MKQKILIVEDAKSLQKAMKIVLENAGYKVYTASDGEEGLNLAFKKKPNLILLDLAMPKKDGIALLKELRQDKWGKDVPVIILTNLSSKEKFMKAAEADVADYYIKSDWEIEEIADLVTNKLLDTMEK